MAVKIMITNDRKQKIRTNFLILILIIYFGVVYSLISLDISGALNIITLRIIAETI
jgi:hypothetical protein